MNNKKIIISIISIILGAVLSTTLAVVPVSAETGTTSTAGAEARLPKIIARSDAAIVARIADLNKLNTRIAGLKNVSDAAKTNIANEVQTNNEGLTSLKAKINADTDAGTALIDEKSIYGSYRIYALVIPQGFILAAADRVGTIADMMTTTGTKLEARINVGKTAGKDVTALETALADFSAKISDARAQAATVESGVASLVPDQGDKTKLQANTAALKAARANIKTATQDLQAARKDAGTIIAGLKALHIPAATSTASTASQ